MDRTIGALLELFGLSDAGEQGIASVLILDEPDSGLDVTAALVMRRLTRLFLQGFIENDVISPDAGSSWRCASSYVPTMKPYEGVAPTACPV